MSAVIAVTSYDVTQTFDLGKVEYHYAADLGLALAEAERYRDIGSVVTVRSQVVDIDNPATRAWYQSVADSDFIQLKKEQVRRRTEFTPAPFTDSHSMARLHHSHARAEGAAPILRFLPHIDTRQVHRVHTKNGTTRFVACSIHDTCRYGTATCNLCTTGRVGSGQAVAAGVAFQACGYAIDVYGHRLGAVHIPWSSVEFVLKNPFQPLRWAQRWEAGELSVAHDNQVPNELPTAAHLKSYSETLPFVLDPLRSQWINL